MTWVWSVSQRFFVNEPALILVFKGAPMLLESEVCSNLCSETVVYVLSVVIEAIINAVKQVRTA